MAVREVSVVRLDEKKSKFYAHLYEIDTGDDVLEVRQIHDRLYKKAAHHCYAMVCGNVTDSRADGEVGSPGRALAEVMERNNLGSHVLMDDANVPSLLALPYFTDIPKDDPDYLATRDFVWSKEKSVHYDVRKLIDVTVAQMRENGSGGVTCEPGLVFFPCNNHPHVALRMFAALGHGDWSADARKWEDWALGHFLKPLFGGGAINIVYHVPSGLFYPRGQSALDGWSLLWYEAWAARREEALALWRQAAAKIDWAAMDKASDADPGGGTCCNPTAVPASVTAVFLAAAARACDDPGTAERLERAVDAKYLVRGNGIYRLDLNREWRIGATAHRIIALAEANGSRFRRLICGKEAENGGTEGR